MEREKLYQKHLEDIFGVRTIEEFSDEEVENAFSVLLQVLPNGGKLYKYRSFEPSKFDNYYAALKGGYLWFPNADQLNDDLDTVLRFDPITEAEKIRNYLLSNPRLYFKAMVAYSPDSVIIGLDERDYKSFREVVDCYDLDTGKMDTTKALRLLAKKGIHTPRALQYLKDVDTFVENFILKNKGALDSVVDSFINVNYPIRRDSFIFAMSETYESNPLWALYANNNHGFCIEYDFNKAKQLNIDSRKRLLNTCRVIYSDEVEAYSFVDVLKYILTGKRDAELRLRSNLNMFKQLLTKTEDWSFEKEWRIMLANLEDNRVQMDLVSKIVIDERAMEAAEAKRLVELCQERNWDVLIRKIQYINVAHQYIPFSEWEQRRQKNARS